MIVDEFPGLFIRPQGVGVMGWLAVQTLEGSFSSVSKPNFASKYSFFRISRDLQDLQTFAPFQIQKSSENRHTFRENENAYFNLLHL